MIKESVQLQKLPQAKEKIEYRLESTSISVTETVVSRSYGIAVYRKGHRLHEVRDITMDRENLQHLVNLCNREQLSFCHLYDLIEDFLGSIYGEPF